MLVEQEIASGITTLEITLFTDVCLGFFGYFHVLSNFAFELFALLLLCLLFCFFQLLPCLCSTGIFYEALQPDFLVVLDGQQSV